MKTNKLEKYLEEISEGTDFSFKVDVESNGEITLYMNGDNPCNEDWWETLTIKNPKNKKKLIENLYNAVTNACNCFDIEENVRLMLEAKANGFRGVPNVVDLVHNEEYKENALTQFSQKLGKILSTL